MIIPQGTYVVRDACFGELGYVADFVHALWQREHGSEIEIGASVERALAYLHHLYAQGQGRVLIAQANAAIVGSMVLEYENVHGQREAIAGGLYCLPQAPRTTVLALMAAGAIGLAVAGYKRVWLTAATHKNKNRRTYAAMGFVPMGMGDGVTEYYCAPLEQVMTALNERF